MERLGFRGNARGAVAVAAAAIALLLAPVGAAQAHQARNPGAGASIITGQPTSIASLPFLAQINFDNGRGGGFGCTGTVVAPRFVLTAGHCVVNLESGGIYPADGYAVLTGVTKSSEAGPANLAKVSRVLAFPKFNTSKVHGDAGLLQLATPVAAPALPLADTAEGTQLTQAGTPLVVAGWGLTETDADRSPDSLFSGEAVTQTASRCAAKSRLFYPFFAPASQFCILATPSAPARTCHGDSGGPAIARRADGSLVEVGITSLGEEKCRAGNPSVFTRVDLVSGWVREWIAAVELGGPLPKVVVPTVRPPFLPTETAEALAYIALSESFRNRFRRGKQKEIACRRIERSRIKCGVSWYQGPNDYWGTITLFLSVSRSEVVWDDRFRIKWVNDRCWFKSGNRRSCKVHTKSR